MRHKQILPVRMRVHSPAAAFRHFVDMLVAAKALPLVLVSVVAVFTLTACSSTPDVQDSNPAVALDSYLQNEPFPERSIISLHKPELWNNPIVTYQGSLRYTTEAVPRGESLRDWSQIIVQQYFTRSLHDHSLESHLQQQRSGIEKACADVNFKTLKESDSDIVYLWQVKGCTKVKDQIELGRLIKTPYGIHRIAYGRRGETFSDAQKQKWLFVVNNTRIKTLKQMGHRAPDEKHSWMRR